MLHVIPFGSFVYGTNTLKSDHDLVVITDELVESKVYEDADVQFYRPEVYQQHLTNHEPWAIELFFTSSTISNDFTFALDRSKLRHAFSAVTSNAYVKCKKKLTVETDEKSFYVGRKSLWHTLRILEFGIQLCNHGKIADFTSANKWYNGIVVDELMWPDLHIKYTPEYKRLCSAFKELAPK